jgi:hypothetical protein
VTARNGAPATGEIFPNGGLNEPARDLRDQGHAGMVSDAMNRQTKETNGYLAALPTVTNDAITGCFRADAAAQITNPVNGEKNRNGPGTAPYRHRRVDDLRRLS